MLKPFAAPPMVQWPSCLECRFSRRGIARDWNRMKVNAVYLRLALFLILISVTALSSSAAPVVTITSPTNGAVLSAPATFTVRASVSGGGNNVSQIEFFAGTNSLGIDTNNPYRMDVNDLPAGTYELSAVLTDNVGGRSTNSVNIIVNALPAVTITTPSDGAGLISPATFALQATASDTDGNITRIQFFRGTTSIGILTNNPASLTVKSLGVGRYVFTALATDNLGGKATNNIDLLVKYRPTVIITAPSSGARLTNITTQLVGTASDSVGVGSVECSLNSGPFATATGTTNWSIALTMPPGTNLVHVRSVDVFGNFSRTNARQFFQVVTSALNLTVNGTGTVAGPTNGQILEIGRGYKLTATPGVGFLFSNWTGTASGVLPTLGFLMQSNMAVQAHFVPNPFLRVSGTFNGLFHEPSQVRHGTSGDFKLSVSSSGKYSASVRLAGRRYSTSGKLNLEGMATNTIVRTGTNSLTVQWAVDLHGLDQVTGSVSDGQWLAELLGDRAIFNATTNRAPLAARYTLVLPGSPGIDSPEGDGWGTLRVSSSGLGTLSGALAEGARLSRSMPVSKGGAWPLYAPLYYYQYSYRGSLLGWIQFDTNAPSDDLNGLVDWSKPALPTARFYPAGFTNQMTLTGSRYVAPVTSMNRVVNLTNGVVILSGGNLSQAWTNVVVFGATRVTNLSPNKLSVTLSPSTGRFTGTFLDTGTVRTVSFAGAVLQKSTNGSGCLLGTNQAGRVLIESRP